MGITQKIIHEGIQILNLYHSYNFDSDLDSIEKVQKRKLASYLKIFKDRWPTAKNYDEFAENLPITDYSYWEDKIDCQREARATHFYDCKRFQPTSGSSQKRKWIPYNKLFLKEYYYGLAPWISNVYKHYPQVKQGYHYFSLSWQPDELRESNEIQNDLNYLSKSSEYFLSKVQAVPSNVVNAKSSEACLFATITWLVSRRELSFLFLWSPTFGLTLLDILEKYKKEITATLRSGKWQLFSSELEAVPCPRCISRSLDLKAAKNLQMLWPYLSLVSCWQSSLSKVWYLKLKQKLSFCDFIENGLVATEGVVTFFHNGKLPLAYKSHFYEFKEIETKIIYPAWKLEKNKIYEVLITSGNGLFRYNLQDQVKVIDFMKNCPCLEFIGRNETLDFVGEKISTHIATQVLDEFHCTFENSSALCLVGIEDEKKTPFYGLLVEGDYSSRFQECFSRQLDEVHHYKLARELHQLGQQEVLSDIKMRDHFIAWKKNIGMKEGDIKIDALVRMSLEDWSEFQHDK